MKEIKKCHMFFDGHDLYLSFKDSTNYLLFCWLVILFIAIILGLQFNVFAGLILIILGYIVFGFDGHHNIKTQVCYFKRFRFFTLGRVKIMMFNYRCFFEFEQYDAVKSQIINFD